MQSITESFTYDDLNRVDRAKHTAGTTITMYPSYHKVSSITGARGGIFHYDAAGNLDCRAWSTSSQSCAADSGITWWSFNLPQRIFLPGASGNYADFSYGPNRERVRTTEVNTTATPSALTSTFWHVGAHFEVENRSDGWTRMRSRVFFAGRPVYDHVDKFWGQSAGLEEAYLHLDHQGSLDRVTPVTAELTGRTYASFDAFGKRRGEDWTNNNLDTLFNEMDFTEFGYTGHQHLDSVKMIHMNGRLQDPIWGRMLSPDPVLGDLTSPQSLNPYSYAWNNPATLSDPTGYESSLCEHTPGMCTSYYLVETRWEGRVQSFSGGVPVRDSGWRDTSSTFTAFLVRDVSFDPGWGGSAGWGVSSPAVVPDPAVASEANADAAGQAQRPIKNWLCGAGNAAARAADSLGSVSGKLELAGLGIAGAGFVMAQPEVTAPGLTLAATGGLGNIGAGVLQFGAGLLQGAGGGGFSNSGYAALSLATGLTLARGITGPAASGYRTVSQRAGDAFANGTATVTGGVNDLWTSLIDAASPRQVDCPGGN